MTKLFDWIGRNLIAIVLVAFVSGIFITLLYLIFPFFVFKVLYIIAYSIGAIGIAINIAFGWFVNPIRNYREKRRKKKKEKEGGL